VEVCELRRRHRRSHHQGGLTRKRNQFCNLPGTISPGGSRSTNRSPTWLQTPVKRMVSSS
jgi:hypothetical protein